jgi:hypothetical protein
MSSMNNRWSGISSPIESMYAGVSADQRESCGRDASMIGADFFRVMEIEYPLAGFASQSLRVCGWALK